MAKSLQELARAKEEETKRWIQRRQAQVDRAIHGIEAKVRQVADTAVTASRRAIETASATSRQVMPKAPPARAAEASKVTKPARQAAAPRGNANQVHRSPDGSVREQVRAATSGFVDELSFGQADRLAALMRATGDLLSDRGVDFATGYRDRLHVSAQQDKYDAEHYATARNTGRATGFVASMAGTGGIGLSGRLAVKGLAKVAPSAANVVARVNAAERIAPLSTRTLAVLAGGGAVSGVAGQSVEDLVNQRIGSLSDYAGAAGGGALGGLASRVRAPGRGALTAAVEKIAPRVAGAVEGASTAGLQSSLSGGALSIWEIANAARAGLVGARVGETAGKYGVDLLSAKAKGRLGEQASLFESYLRGEGWAGSKGPLTAEIAQNLPRTKGSGPQRWVHLSRGHTVADHVTPTGKAVEAKFGAEADLSSAQRRARDELGPRELYRIDHWLPIDIGNIGAVNFGAIASPFSTRYREENNG